MLLAMAERMAEIWAGYPPPFTRMRMSRLANLSWPRMRTGSKALRRSASGSMFSMGWPFTLMRPRPCLAKAQAVAVFFFPKTWTDWVSGMVAVNILRNKGEGRRWIGGGGGGWVP